MRRFAKNDPVTKLLADNNLMEVDFIKFCELNRNNYNARLRHLSKAKSNKYYQSTEEFFKKNLNKFLQEKSIKLISVEVDNYFK